MAALASDTSDNGATGLGISTIVSRPVATPPSISRTAFWARTRFIAVSSETDRPSSWKLTGRRIVPAWHHRALLQGRLDFPDLGTNYGYMNATKKIRRDFLFRVCPIAGS
ncbi:hypothetical protein [Mesorhizobium sp.]|uniref:hypothetical protein n=1 Tax=Mesorhizobium sp. TaxID=1871066 RepID=UPI0011F8F6A1|nr:hypothetical protein [Mesorhizobium sp.]TIL35617.1 MAG: hypothetical protein E5Y85_06160 [Mesorhizobium sp.]